MRRTVAFRCKCLLLMMVVFCEATFPDRIAACCAVARTGHHMINSDQAVIIIWDAQRKVQHFIRRATFEGGAADFGFIIPSPSRPDLQEVTDEAFGLLDRLTARPVRIGGSDFGVGNSWGKHAPAAPAVRVLEVKQVAGFDAAVLEADSADVLVQWLKTHDYSYSPAVRDWAKPYIDAKWKFTALKISASDEHGDRVQVAAKPLRMSFHTDRPLFPYREPAAGVESATTDEDTVKGLVESMRKGRTLTIYFLADTRYYGRFEGMSGEPPVGEQAWSGRPTFAHRLQPEDHRSIVKAAGVPELADTNTGWLTKFEDDWPRQVHGNDVYFRASPDTAVPGRY